jgi:hypothetical protein
VNLTIAAWTVGVVGVVVALHLTALWMERRGWIFYKHTKASSSSASNAFMSVQAIFEPRAEYVVEGRRSDDVGAVEEAGSGDPPGRSPA